MEQFIATKDKGLSKMNKKNYKKAIEDFKVVTDSLNPENDEQAVLKAVCFLNTSLCYLGLLELDQALEAANQVIKLYESQRSEEQQKQMTPEQISADPLTNILCLAYCRRGQVFQLKKQALEALQQYSVAIALVANCEGQKLMQDLLEELGFPKIDQTDKDLQLFSFILIHLLNELNLLVAITNLLTFLVEGKPTDECLIKFSKCATILVGVMQLYMDNETIIVACLSAMRVLAEKGVQSVFNGIAIVRVVMEHWSKNVNIIGDSIRLIVLSPPDLTEMLLRLDFIPAICEALKLELKPDEIDDSYYLLYHLMVNDKVATQIAAEGIIEDIHERHTDSAFKLLSKLANLNDVANSSAENGDMDWAIEKVGSEDSELIQAATHFIARMLQYHGPTESVKVFDAIYPMLMTHKKDKDIIANSYCALALTLPEAIAKVTENKAIIAASVLLSLYMDDLMVTANILFFIYTAAENGLVDEVKEVKAVLPTALKAVKQFPDNLIVVENAIGLACLLDHPNKAEFLKAAIQQFGKSATLYKYVTPVLGIKI